MTLGIVYIARNDTHEADVYKIGMTLRTNLDERMDELTNHTGVLGQFRYMGYVLVDDVETCESKLHENLSAYRVQNNREFFRISLREIVFSINNIIADKIIRNHLPLVSSNEEVSLDYFLTFQNLMSFLRFYHNYGCSNDFCGLCLGRVYPGLIIFLCKSLGYDLSSKIKRLKLFFKLSGRKESTAWDDPYYEETSIHFDDLTEEYKNKIYEELFSQMSELNDNEINTLTNKMVDFLNHLIIKANQNYKKIFNTKFNNNFIKWSKFTELEINSLSNQKIRFIEMTTTQDRDNLDPSLKDIFEGSGWLQWLENRKKKNAEIAYQNFLKQEEDEKKRKLEKELKLKQKQDKHKLFLKNQKLRNEQRQLYISKLKNMSLLDRINNIITELPFGIKGIPFELFETENLQKVYFSLDDINKKKLIHILSSRKEKNFKNFIKSLSIIT